MSYVYTYPLYWNYPSNRTVKCRKKECIYWSAVSLYGSDTDRCEGYCGNYNLLMDEFGVCRCFVKDNKEKTSDEQE